MALGAGMSVQHVAQTSAPDLHHFFLPLCLGGKAGRDEELCGRLCHQQSRG